MRLPYPNVHWLHLQLLEVEGKTKLRLISAELELLLQLYAHGRLTSSELAHKVRCSTASFGLVKKRLLDCNLLVTQRCTIDRRVIFYALTPEILQFLQNLDLPKQGSDESKSVFSGFSEPLATREKEAIKA